MKTVEFEGQNRVFHPPEGWDQDRDGICGVLPVRIDRYQNNITTYTSYWKPSEADLKLLNEGACVGLSVIGGQPPVMAFVEKIKELP